MMRIKLLVVSLMLSIFASCIDSPLSDVELTDFSVIKVQCKVGKDFLSSSTQNSCFVQISDKNGFGVKIKNGSVSVNGTKLSYDEIFKYYSMPSTGIPVTKNTLYSFVITLSNGDTCMARVKTPSTEFGAVVYPSPIHVLQDTVITWSEYAGQSNQITLEIDVDSNVDTLSQSETVISRSIPDIGRFALTHDLFNPARHRGDGTISFTSSTGGSVSSKVRAGSEASARFTWLRSVRLEQ